MAKPLLNYFRPELAGFVQPLAGEFAAPRKLLCNIPFLTGYGVEMGILVDVLSQVGLPGMAQVDLGTRQNRHQPLWELTRMSSAVLQAMARRVDMPGRERPVPSAGDAWPLGMPDVYMHAVSAQDGMRLDEHLNELLERPPISAVLPVGWGQHTVA
jgi:glucosyl-3-phosphoglycerate synthase